MLKSQLLILLLTFYIHNALTKRYNFDLLRTWKWVREAINVIDDIQKMKSNDILRENFWSRITPLRASLEVKFSKIPFSVEGFDCDISTGNWLITEDVNRSKISEVWNNATDCLQKNEDSIRGKMLAEFNQIIKNLRLMNHGEKCIGPIAFDRIHKYYLMMVNYEVNKYVMYAGARADISFKNKVEQQTTPKYSDKLGSYYLDYTRNLVSALQDERNPFSANCNGENTAPTQDGDSIRLYGSYQTTIFQYNYYRCGYYWHTCDYLLHSARLTARCDVSWFPEQNHEFFIHKKVCHYLGDVQACFSGNTNQFSYIDSYKLGLVGHKHNCSAPDEKLLKVAYSASTPYSACSCGGINVNWRINLGSITSDTTNNYVIVGVSFILINRTLTLRAAEGKLRSLGYITDFRWIPLSNLNENFIFDPTYPAFSLEKLQLESGHVMTGISLKKSEPFPAKHLTLVIVGAPFDPESGLLSDNSMQRHQSRDTGANEFGETFGPVFDAPSLTIPKTMRGLHEIALVTSGNEHIPRIVSFAYRAIDYYDLYNYLEMIQLRGLTFYEPVRAIED